MQGPPLRLGEGAEEGTVAGPGGAGEGPEVGDEPGAEGIAETALHQSVGYVRIRSHNRLGPYSSTWVVLLPARET
jgi:hypothetical protein